jgi:DNA-binding CsgD family transcriptional regulator
LNPELEEQLGTRMKRLAKFENRRAQKLWGSSKHFAAVNQNRINGALGGRKRIDIPIIPLTPHARRVNKMVQRGLSQRDIADILDTSKQAVNQIVLRYRLPRDS